MISEKERKILIDNWVHTILKRDAAAKNFDIIEKLWESSTFTNKDLVDVLMSDRENDVSDFKESIFGDIVWLLMNAIYEDKALRSLFRDLYARRYPNADKYIEKIENKILNGDKVQVSMPDVAGFVKKDKNTAEAEYFIFRIYDSDVVVYNDCIDSRFWTMEYENSLRNLIKGSDVGDDEICFDDDKRTPVFKSKMYERFVKKQREALASYLNVEEDKLAEYYDKSMTILENVGGYGFVGSALGLIPAAIIEMMWLNGGSGIWLQNIQSLNRKNKLAYKYRPDFDKLFERYCRASVRMDYQVFDARGELFTPLTLARQCCFVEMEALAVSIGYMYMSDCLYQLFKQLQKQYYEDFSWEKYRNRDMKTRYESVIGELNASLAVRDKQLQQLQVHYASLKASLEKKNDLALLKELQDKERLLEANEEKDVEIERLKALVASQNQMIEQLQTLPSQSVVEEAESRFNSDADNTIYHYKYLFVGDITNLGFEELKRKFPSSIFMESNTANISQVQVDAVVYLIQSMGHSMYYKCKNTPALRDVRVIYYNGRGDINSLFETMESQLQTEVK